MKTKRYFFVSILFFLSFVFTSLFVENVGVFTEQAKNGFDIISFVILFFICSALLLAFYFIFFIRCKEKNDFAVIAVLGIILIVGLIGIWSTKNVEYACQTKNGVIALNVQVLDKIIYSIELLVGLFFLYALFFCYTKTKTSFKDFLWMPVLLIAFNYIAVAITPFTDYQVYYDMFSGLPSNGVESLFLNKNLYGFSLILGIFSCFVVNTKKTKWWSIVSIFVFLIAMFFTKCATTLLVSIVVIPLYFLIIIICGIKKHYIRNTIFLTVLIFALTGVIICLGLSEAFPETKLHGIMFSFFYNLSDKDLGTFSLRSYTWNNVLNLCWDSPFRAIFGYGFKTSQKVLEAYTFANRGIVFSSAHNAFLEVLFRYGLIGLILYCLGILYLLSSLVYLIIKKKIRFALTYFCSILGLLACGILESYTFFTANLSGILMTLVFALPIFIEAKSIKHHENCDYINALTISPLLDKSKTLYQASMLFLISLIFIPVCAFMCKLTYTNNLWIYSISAMLTIIILFLFVPYILRLWSKTKSRKRFLFRILFYPSIILIGVILLLVFRKYFPFPIAFLLPLFLLAILIIMLLAYWFPCKGNFSEYLPLVYQTGIKSIWVSLLGGLGGSVIAGLLSLLLPINLFSFILLLFLPIIGFYLPFFLGKKDSEFAELLNNMYLTRNQR